MQTQKAEITKTPLSDHALANLWPEFTEKVKERLERGKIEYGDPSFLAELSALAEEIDQELLDQAGWAFIAWCNHRKLKRQIVRFEWLMKNGVSKNDA